MKKYFIAIGAVLISALLIFVIGKYNGFDGAKNEKFQGIVLEIGEDFILVQPAEDEDGKKLPQEVLVSRDIVSDNEVPELKEGDKIRVIYNGDSIEKEGKEAKIAIVFNILLLNELK